MDILDLAILVGVVCVLAVLGDYRGARTTDKARDGPWFWQCVVVGGFRAAILAYFAFMAWRVVAWIGGKL